MVGSLGTLGFIATVTFRLHPRPETERTVLFPDLDAEAVRQVVLALREAQLEPARSRPWSMRVATTWGSGSTGDSSWASASRDSRRAYGSRR
jgi:FAD/FMN-containing dehydrogenase